MRTWVFRIAREGESGAPAEVELTDTQSLLHLHETLVKFFRLDPHAPYAVYATGVRDDTESAYGEMKDGFPNLASRALLRNLGLEMGKRILHWIREGDGIWHVAEATRTGEKDDDVRYPRILEHPAPMSPGASRVEPPEDVEARPAQPASAEPGAGSPAPEPEPSAAATSPREGEPSGLGSMLSESAEVSVESTDSTTAPEPPSRPAFEPAPDPAPTREGWLPGLAEAIARPSSTFPRPPAPSLGRNDPCPCGSGRKYKKCCLGKGG